MLAGCSGSGDPGTTETTDPGATAVATSLTETARPDTTSTPAPNPTPTSAPTAAPAASTTPPPAFAPIASISQVALADDTRPDRIERVNDVTVFTGASDVAVLVGSVAAAPGEPERAAVHTTSDGETIVTSLLDDAGAIESRAFEVAATPELIVVAGERIDATGAPQPVVWRSVDGGTSFGGAEPVGDQPGLVSGVGIVDGRPLAVMWVDSERSYDLAIARETDSGWVTTPLTTGAVEPRVSGVAVGDRTIVVTGSWDDGGRDVALGWVSTDGGATFTTVTDVLASFNQLGKPALGGDGFVATADGYENATTVLVTSADGLMWRAIGLLAPAGDPSETYTDAGSAVVVAFGSKLAVGIDDFGAEVAVVDPSGRVEHQGAAPDLENELFFDPVPFVLNGTLHVVADSRRSFLIAAYDPTASDRWTERGAPGDRPIGPTAAGASLFSTASGTVANTLSYPRLTRPPQGTAAWAPSDRWSERADVGWSTASSADFPSSSRVLASNGTSDVRLRVGIEDAADDELGGPLGGTGASVRSIGGSWGRTTQILSGPGGDYLVDVAPVGDGFVAVGFRSHRDAAGIYTGTIAIVEYTAGRWVETPVDVPLAPIASLDRVVATASGLVYATGTQFADGRSTPIVLTRAAAGNWAPASLPTSGLDVTIVDVVAGADAVDILTREDGAWFRYRTTDGVNFERAAVAFADAPASYPAHLLAFDDRTLLVGTIWNLGTSRLTMWELAADGTTNAIELAEPKVGSDLFVTDALVADGTVLVAGILRFQNVVWEIAPP